MYRIIFTFSFVLASVLNVCSQSASSAIIDSSLVFGEKNGLIVIEAEHFYKQTKTDKRAWYINSPVHSPLVWPDYDTASYVDAGGFAYIEALPDLFHSEDDPIIPGDNLGSNGDLAVVHYKVYFNQPGRYYIWTRLRSNDQEDNTIGGGINNTFPKNAQILQSPVEKKQWIWKSDNRLSRNPWKIGRASIDVSIVGLNIVQFYMREDGEEFDRFILTRDSLFSISDNMGPKVTVKSGRLHKSFKATKAKIIPEKGLTNPDGSIYGANVLYKDTLGMVVFEAENFYRQTKTETRMWHLVTENYVSNIGPDNDLSHTEGASERAYLELLPDGRQKDEDGINSKSSICGNGGEKAVLSYMINFQDTGTYYLWIRALAIDGDDNTLHVGVDGTWPLSGKKLTFHGRNWNWSNVQRDTKAKISIPIAKKGIHEVQLSMREDGCEIDRIILTKNPDFVPVDGNIFPSGTIKGEIKKWYEQRENLMDASFSYAETGGIVFIEAESAPTANGWLYKADTSQHSGLGYLEWGEAGQGIKAGKGILNYNFSITQAGNYQLFIRGKMFDPANRPETPDADGNDVWVKFSGGTDVKGQTLLGDDFSKVAILGHPRGWTWNTNADRGAPHNISPVCRYFSPGNYTLQLSGRSNGYAIDCMVLENNSKKPQSNFSTKKLNGFLSHTENRRLAKKKLATK